MLSIKTIPKLLLLLLAALPATAAGAVGDRAATPAAGRARAESAPAARPGTNATAATEPDAVALRKECEYGVTLAFAGETTLAESVFISLLSHASGDPRALTNLGNVHFLRGDLEVALAFYDGALRGDSADAGIRLNRAATYYMLGEPKRAQDEADQGMKMAGGPKAAQALMGIRYVGEQPKASELSAQIVGFSPGKGNRRTRLSKDEIRALLGAGATAGDQSAAKDGQAVPENQKSGNNKPAGAASGTGTKASDEGNAATLLYWKR